MSSITFFCSAAARSVSLCASFIARSARFFASCILFSMLTSEALAALALAAALLAAFAALSAATFALWACTFA